MTYQRTVLESNAGTQIGKITDADPRANYAIRPNHSVTNHNPSAEGYATFKLGIFNINI